MKAHKIDLSDYEPKGSEAKTVKPREVFGNLITHQGLQLKTRQLLAAGDLADRFDEAPEDFILLDRKSYDLLKTAIEKIAPIVGLSRPHIPLLERVFDAPLVEMEPVKSPPDDHDDEDE